MLEAIGNFIKGLADQIVAFPGEVLRELKVLDLQALSHTVFSTTGLVVAILVIIFILMLRPTDRG